MRFLTPCLLSLSLGFYACASPGGPNDDPVHRAMAVVAGFHDASPAVADRLGKAAAWAVFPDAAPIGPEAGRPGFLFSPNHRSIPVELRRAKSAPVSAARHVLVIFSDEEQVPKLEHGPFMLDDAADLRPHDAHGAPEERTDVWVITSAVSGLLFTPEPTRAGWSIRLAEPK